MNSLTDFWKSRTTLMAGPTFQIGLHMSKKPSSQPKLATTTTVPINSTRTMTPTGNHGGRRSVLRTGMSLLKMTITTD
jgi:hypothetical protein